MSITICSRPFVKHFSGVDATPRFSKNNFQENFLSVPILEFFAPLQGFPKVMMLTIMPLILGNK
jgi:hypothetical protein